MEKSTRKKNPDCIKQKFHESNGNDYFQSIMFNLNLFTLNFGYKLEIILSYRNTIFLPKKNFLLKPLLIQDMIDLKALSKFLYVINPVKLICKYKWLEFVDFSNTHSRSMG